MFKNHAYLISSFWLDQLFPLKIDYNSTLEFGTHSNLTRFFSSQVVGGGMAQKISRKFVITEDHIS